jgi:hypothetical protein
MLQDINALSEFLSISIEYICVLIAAHAVVCGVSNFLIPITGFLMARL